MAHLPGFFSSIITIALPITLQNLLQNFVNMLDTVMVGRLGAVEIASVGLGNQIFFLLGMMLFGISSGGSIFVAQFWGAHDIPNIKRTTGITLSLSLIASSIFFIGAFFFPRTLISFYSNDETVIKLGAKYLRAISFSYPLTATTFAFQISFRSTEHVRLPMVSTAVSFVTNIVSNLILIFGFSFQLGSVSVTFPALGVTGAAIATLISRLVEFIITLGYAYSHHFEAAGKLHELFSFDKKFFIRFVKIALPVIINESLWSLGITTHNAIFARTGTEAFASYNITGTVSQLTWTFFIGLGNGAAIILGKKIGAHHDKEAKQYAFRFAWFMPLLAACISFLLLPLSFLLPHIFNVSEHIIHQSQMMMRVLMCFYPFNAFNMFFIVGLCRSGGDTIYSAVNDLIWMWLIAIPLAAVAAFLWHVDPFIIYLCLLSENIFKATAGIIRLRNGKWMRHVTE